METATEDEVRSLTTLYERLALIKPWEELLGLEEHENWEIVPGSDLALDDAATHPYPVSAAARTALVAAIDHLLCFRDSLFKEVGDNHIESLMRLYSQSTLLRCALENAARAVWFLEGKDRPTRITRRLQADYDERKQLDQVAQEIGSPSPKSMPQHLADLTAIATAAGINIDSKIIKNDGDGYGAIVKIAGAHLDIRDGATQAFIVWKACSALAHGETRGTIAYLKKQVIFSSTPGFKLAKTEADVNLICMGAYIAMSFIDSAFKLYRKLARSNVIP